MQTRKAWLLALALPVALMVFGLAATACGGDDDDDDAGGVSVGGGTGSDEDYVADLCEAGKDLEAALTKATQNLSAETDPSKIGAALAEPFEKFANAVDKAKPPKDLKDWHTQTSAQLNRLAKELKEKKDISALASLSADPIPDPPQDAQDRLQKIAEKDKNCTEAGFTFDD